MCIRAGAHRVRKCGVGHQAPPGHDLVAEHGDVGRRAAERGQTQAQEQGRHFADGAAGGRLRLRRSAGEWAVRRQGVTQVGVTQGRRPCCGGLGSCLLYTSPRPRDRTRSRLPSSACNTNPPPPPPPRPPLCSPSLARTMMLPYMSTVHQTADRTDE